MRAPSPTAKPTYNLVRLNLYRNFNDISAGQLYSEWRARPSSVAASTEIGRALRWLCFAGKPCGLAVA